MPIGGIAYANLGLSRNHTKSCVQRVDFFPMCPSPSILCFRFGDLVAELILRHVGDIVIPFVWVLNIVQCTSYNTWQSQLSCYCHSSSFRPNIRDQRSQLTMCVIRMKWLIGNIGIFGWIGNIIPILDALGTGVAGLRIDYPRVVTRSRCISLRTEASVRSVVPSRRPAPSVTVWASSTDLFAEAHTRLIDCGYRE